MYPQYLNLSWASCWEPLLGRPGPQHRWPAPWRKCFLRSFAHSMKKQKTPDCAVAAFPLLLDSCGPCQHSQAAQPPLVGNQATAQRAQPHLRARRTNTSYVEGRSAGVFASMQSSTSALTDAGHSSGTRGARRWPRSGRSRVSSSCARPSASVSGGMHDLLQGVNRPCAGLMRRHRSFKARGGRPRMCSQT